MTTSDSEDAFQISGHRIHEGFGYIEGTGNDIDLSVVQ